MPEPSPEAVEALFQEAADLDPAQRGAFLDRECAGDADLRGAVEELLAFDARAGAATDFLRGPAAEVRAALPLTDHAVPASFGPYRVVRRLGEGGMGTVYEAEQDEPRRTVALKVMRPGLDSRELRKRFAREARILGRLDHVGIARVYDAGATEYGRLYLAREFIHGPRLDDHVRRHVPDVRARLELMARLCDAVQHAHDQGVVHRDLKPAKVLVDEAGQPKVLDFGVAHATGAGHLGSTAHTRPGQLIGTLGYMSPEQVAGDPRAVDARSDVYTLGVILFELLADRLPYRLEDLPVPEIVRMIREDEPSRLGALDRRFRGDVETIVARALEKDRARRYQSAGELADDLRRHLAHEPIRARPVGRGQRAVKWVRRHPGEAASVAGTVATFLAAFAAVSWSYFRAETARQAEAEQRQRAEGNERAELWGRYRANIAAASSALQLQNTAAARAALEDAPTERRNWEWHHLHSQLDGASLVVPLPGAKAWSYALSPSGRQIAVCCFPDRAIYLYDADTGRLESILRGHSAPATSVAYRPDGRQLATVGDDQTVRLWDPATGRQTALLKAERAPAKPDLVLIVAYNADGSRIASFPAWLPEAAGASRLWDPITGKEVAVLTEWRQGGQRTVFRPDGQRVAVGSDRLGYLYDAVTGRRLAVLGPHRGPIHDLAYGPDGRLIASTTDPDGATIHLWDGESGKEVAVLPTPWLDTARFSPNGSRLISASIYPDNTARLWDTASGRLMARLEGHRNWIRRVAFSPDGGRAVTTATDQTARLWDGRTGGFLAVLGGHTGGVQHGLFSPDGTRVDTASEDASLRLWDARKGELIGVFRGHGDPFWEDGPPVFTPDGSRLVSGSDDGTMRVWDISLAERNGVLRGHESMVYDVAFRPDGQQVASAAWDGTVRLWDATTDRQIGRLKHEAGIIASVAYSRDGRQLVTVGRERGVTLWDVESRKAVRDWRVPVGGWRGDSRATFDTTGMLVAAASAQGPVRLWDVATGREVARFDGHDGNSLDVAFDPDGGRLATGGIDGTVRLWDVAARAPVAVLKGHNGVVWRVAFSPDGKRLASGSSDRTVRLWDARTHAHLAAIPVGSIAYGVAFSPDSTRLAAGCADTSVRLIDVASRQEVVELRGHTDYVHAVAWSPDGTRLVSGSGDFTVRVWDSLSAQERARRSADASPPR